MKILIILNSTLISFPFICIYNRTFVSWFFIIFLIVSVLLSSTCTIKTFFSETFLLQQQPYTFNSMASVVFLLSKFCLIHFNNNILTVYYVFSSFMHSPNNCLKNNFYSLTVADENLVHFFTHLNSNSRIYWWQKYIKMLSLTLNDWKKVFLYNSFSFM